MSAQPTCDLCGTPAGPSGNADETPTVPLGWTTSVENGCRTVLCEACSREHLRSIEGKLDSAWW